LGLSLHPGRTGEREQQKYQTRKKSSHRMRPHLPDDTWDSRVAGGMSGRIFRQPHTTRSGAFERNFSFLLGPLFRPFWMQELC
jgi:hypothetical protein